MARACVSSCSGAKGTTSKPCAARKVFSRMRSCAIATARAAGATRDPREELERRRGDVLELGRRRTALRGEGVQARGVEVIGAHVAIGHGARGAVVARIEHRDAIAEALRRHAEHAAELSASEQAEP